MISCLYVLYVGDCGYEEKKCWIDGELRRSRQPWLDSWIIPVFFAETEENHEKDQEPELRECISAVTSIAAWSVGSPGQKKKNVELLKYR
jgi:hypothetical protein